MNNVFKHSAIKSQRQPQTSKIHFLRNLFTIPFLINNFSQIPFLIDSCGIANKKISVLTKLYFVFSITIYNPQKQRKVQKENYIRFNFPIEQAMLSVYHYDTK